MSQDEGPTPVDAGASDGVFPRLFRRNVDACAFATWYPNFKRVTPKATIIPLDNDFIDYLKADGVFLPNDDSGSEDSDFDANGATSDDGSHEDDPPRPHYDFSQLSQQIQSVIDEYEAVFPKLNWSSPQDATWMGAGPPLKCQTPDDVYLLFKASDFIAHDLDHAYEGCEDDEQCSGPRFHLVLKKWFAMPKSHEFRCFVQRRRLIGISQRDSNFYDFLQDLDRQTAFRDIIYQFFNESISAKFDEENCTGLVRYQAPLTVRTDVFDVYLTQDESRVFLIDFNPYAPTTDSLLFTYEDLRDILLSGTPAPIRFIRSEAQASQSMPRHSHNRYPKDVVELSNGSSIAEFAQKWRDVMEEASKEGTPMSSVTPVDPEIPGR